MDLKNNTTLAWSVAAVLALLLVITLIANMDPAGVNWNDVRDRIREECSDTSEEGRDACMRSLQQLEEALIEVNRDIGQATSTPIE